MHLNLMYGGHVFSMSILSQYNNIGDEFLTFHENGNTKDKYVIIAVTPADSKSECKQIVGHLPQEILKICFYFIAHS